MARRATAAKREAILEAAEGVFAEAGLEGASLRAVAQAAGYTPAALYFHFDSKEALYAEMLGRTLERLGAAVRGACTGLAGAAKFRAAAMAFFGYYAENPRDLDLGFYLLRGGMRPAGLGRARDEALNAALAAALAPLDEAARALGATPEAAQGATVETFAQATGLLLLLHTGRIRMFNASAPALMEAHTDRLLATFDPS
ncbi:helix-turn-helix domain-containing protein [Vannielia litorea]|uniref:Transcriptional regulator, TetR family n=1 Tax=Vannielia litorea TaxID=1217970 RepID=A0A1N6GAH1_9RHOB|nr:helix-turn-helix domain-containing protein [Vannielia litorea]SIO04549.1 transcriptional regulator, TetR family [Vannielia litorea]